MLDEASGKPVAVKDSAYRRAAAALGPDHRRPLASSAGGSRPGRSRPVSARARPDRSDSRCGNCTPRSLRGARGQRYRAAERCSALEAELAAIRSGGAARGLDTDVARTAAALESERLRAEIASVGSRLDDLESRYRTLVNSRRWRGVGLPARAVAAARKAPPRRASRESARRETKEGADRQRLRP
jgi:hypothetical protein